MNRVASYKDLLFWKTSRDSSLKIFALTEKLPNQRASWIIVDQLLRACFSIGANIAEGYGKYKGKEYARFLQISLGSSRETEYWLELLKDLFPKFSQEIEEILKLNDQTTRMLVKSLQTLRS